MSACSSGMHGLRQSAEQFTATAQVFPSDAAITALLTRRGHPAHVYPTQPGDEPLLVDVAWTPPKDAAADDKFVFFLADRLGNPLGPYNDYAPMGDVSRGQEGSWQSFLRSHAFFRAFADKRNASGDFVSTPNAYGASVSPPNGSVAMTTVIQTPDEPVRV